MQTNGIHVLHVICHRSGTPACRWANPIRMTRVTALKLKHQQHVFECFNAETYIGASGCKHHVFNAVRASDLSIAKQANTFVHLAASTVPVGKSWVEKSPNLWAKRSLNCSSLSCSSLVNFSPVAITPQHLQ